MGGPTFVRRPHLAPAAGLLAISLVGLFVGPACAAEPAAEAAGVGVARGQELFARAWLPNDPRSHGGDGLGPVFNERSCLGCHHQGGAGGAAAADRNIEIVTAGDGASAATGAFYGFAMSFGSSGFQYRFANNAPQARPRALNAADLAQIHPGFRETPSVVLHRFGPDADYRTWRESIPGPHGTILLRSSQRNPTPLFGVGLIDAIPDAVLESAARRRFAGSPQVRGRVSRLGDGRIGRFGWKAQTASLEEFVLTAASVELGLEVPGRHQASDPRIPALPPIGLDLDQDECDSLVAYLRSLPPPSTVEAANPREAQQVKAGAALFKAIGCATCHLPKLGDVEVIYSDLLLHDMSPRLGDTSVYGVFAAQPAAIPAGRKPSPGATVAEWRTPPLWGLRDSAPYLHDGRAETIDQAIQGHGGQAAPSAERHAGLSPRERTQLEAFLLSLAAPR